MMNILYLSFINQFAIVAISLLSVYYPLPILLRSHPFSVFGSGDLPNQTKMAAHNNKEPNRASGPTVKAILSYFHVHCANLSRQILLFFKSRIY